MNEETLLESTECISKVAGFWRSLLSALRADHRIHPLGPINAKDCDFIVIDSHIHIRVIHVSPGNENVSSTPSKNTVPNCGLKRNSFTEEYWFTKWNKSLKIGNCNCSFRHSMRYSIISNQSMAPNTERKSVLNNDLPTMKNIENFVERLIQNALFEALQECMLRNKSESGKTNLAYEATEKDDSVTLPRKLKSFKNVNLISIKNVCELSSRKANSLNGSKSNCVHKKVQKKPLVILQHGIGASADVWYTIINALVCRGFEVIAPDLLGHGFSSAPTKSSYYTFNNLLLQALTIFDHYMIDEKRKCVLIGHSYGCSLVTAMYPHRAQQIAQLILISGGGPTPLAAPVNENEISPFGCVYTLLHPLLYCGLKRSFFYSSRGKHFKACVIDSALPNHILENIVNGQIWPEGDTSFHRRILVPTLLVHGLQDENVTLVQECEMERV